MTWYEKSGSGYRARWKEPGRATAAAGPIKPSREEARQWAIERRLDAPDIVTLAELVKRWKAVHAANRRLMPSHLEEVEQRVMALAEQRKWHAIADVTLPAINDWKVDVEGVGVARPLSYLLSVLRWGWRECDVPVDSRVLRLRTPRPVRKLADELLTDRQLKRIITAAAKMGVQAGAVIHYLATYGARPITACTRTVGDVDFVQGTLDVAGKRSGEWRHALLPETLKLFAGITKGRPLDAPLFLDPRTGRGWPISFPHRASVLSNWYAYRLGRPLAGDALGGIYHLKRKAITTLLQRGMDPATVARFTGHLTIAQVLVYERSNERVTKDHLHLLCGGSTQNTQCGRGRKGGKRR